MVQTNALTFVMPVFFRCVTLQAIRKRQEEEAKRQMEELQARAIDADAKFASLDEEINVSTAAWPQPWTGGGAVTVQPAAQARQCWCWLKVQRAHKAGT